MTDRYEELVQALAAESVEVMKAGPKMGRAEAARVAARARWGNQVRSSDRSRMVGGKDGQGEVVSSRRVSRDKDVAGLTPGQKAKYDAYMEYTAGRKDKRSADLIHSDAMMHAMNPKAPSIPKAQSQSSGPKVTRKPRNPGAYAPIESIRSAIKEHDALLRENLTARSRKQVESARERAVEILAAAEKRQKKIKGEAQKLGEESKKKYKEYGY